MEQKQMCYELENALKAKGCFNVSGGCGIDMSNGESKCMANSGKWFKFCPFCGKQIKTEYDEQGHFWSWREV